MTLEDLTIYVLRECIRLVVYQLDENHFDDPVFDVLAYKMSTYINVLCSVAILGVVAEEDCSHVVAPDCYGVCHVDSKKFKQLIKIILAQNFLTTTYSASVNERVTLFCPQAFHEIKQLLM